ncbi:DHHC zinc finger domain containing protein [Tritrichomonas foetus]|uniref:Palmitoyltransferase n=1 Tax=Tritrichomonas foetus TaxID=1144522 RepID=A0A1J4K4D4_9EUKA|nr:DHHC zinc finger domain containing protein [Tritrichomonas foetus]|eukprot:OHT04357.1 DHHC zinc finger domain containing protein [Tritrichomonas foetus]
MCNFAPKNGSDVAARVIIAILFAFAQVVFPLFVLKPLSEKPGDSYIAFIVTMCIWIVFSILWIWAYVVTCWLDPGSLECELKKYGYLVDGQLTNLPPELKALPRCMKCGLPKPNRTHHCSQCGKCYFRFDHHCPIIGNCVALNNMKAFMLMMIYSFFLLLNMAGGCICSIIFNNSISKIILGLFAALFVLFGLSVGCFGFSYCPTVFFDRTTLENIAGINENAIEVKKSQKFKDIFGYNCFTWFTPTKPPIDGFQWSGITIEKKDINETIQDYVDYETQNDNISDNFNETNSHNSAAEIKKERSFNLDSEAHTEIDIPLHEQQTVPAELDNNDNDVVP